MTPAAGLDAAASSIDAWLTPAQAAQQIGLHEATIRRAIKRAQLRAVRVGGGRTLRLRQSWLNAWMESFDAAPVSREPLN